MRSQNDQKKLRGILPLRTWFQTPLGEEFAMHEKNAMDKVLPNLFGYHLLQIGTFGIHGFLESSRIQHRVVIEWDYSYRDTAIGAYAKLEALPIATDSTDAVVLPHALEFADAPHQVLREAERILIPEGNLIIIGFNPFSLMGLRKLFIWRKREMPWRGKYISIPRIRDWLSLLGFDIETTEYRFFRLPVQWTPFLKRFRFMDRLGEKLLPFFGSVYIVHAKKRVTTLTPVKPRWMAKPRLVSTVARPQTRAGAPRETR